MIKNKKKMFLSILSVTTILIVLIGNIVFAASSAELREQQKQKENEINAAKQEQEKIKNQMTAIQKEVDDINSKINSAETEIESLSLEIDEKTQMIDEATVELEKTQKELEKKEETLQARLVASYKAGETTYLDVLLTSENLTSFLSNYYFIEQINQYDTELIDTIKETKRQIEINKQKLEEAKKTLEDAKASVVNKKAQLAVLKNEKAQKMTGLSAEEQALQKRIDEMRAQDAAIQAAIRRAQAQEAASGNGGGQQVARGGYIWPVPAAYAKVTTGLYYSSGAYHGAIDFGVAGINGQPVYAVKAGTVVLTERLTYSYGNYVLINHHDGTYTLYAHGQAGSICVSEGQNVSQGQQIMRVGSTGNSTGPHLHFEVRVAPGGYANRVNPLNYL